MLKSTKITEKTSSLLGSLFAWLPIDPNTITLASVILALLGFLTFGNALEAKIISLVFFLLAFAFDALDGAIARAKNTVTKTGAFIDGIADRIVEFFLILVFFKMSPYLTLQLALLSILFFGTCMTAFVKAYAEHQGLLAHKQAMKMPGLLERTERSLLLIIAFALFIFGFVQYGIYSIYLIATLSAITFIHRFFIVFLRKNF